MQSVRALILRKYNRQLQNAKTAVEQERIKGKIYAFLERCKKQDVKKRIYHL